MVKIEHIQVLVLLMHDFNWMAWRPMLGIPAMIIGICIQLKIVSRSFVIGGVSFVNQVGLLFWFIGNDIWTCGEYVWDADKPAGILAYFRFLYTIDKRWYTVVMAVALTIQSAAVVGLLGFYLHRLLSVVAARACSCFRRAPAVLPVTTAATPLAMAQQTHPNAVEVQAEEEATEVLARMSIPLDVYCQLFVLPWIVMDTGWVCCNFLDTLGIDGGMLVNFSSAAGCVAILLLADCVRWQFTVGERRDVAAALAELIWLVGNLIWMLHDLQIDSPVMYNIAVILFAIGCSIIIGCICCSIHWPLLCRRASARTPTANADITPTANADITPTANADIINDSFQEICVPVPRSLTDPIKIHKRTKRREPWIDHFEVGRHLQQWRERLPCVHPFYRIGQQADLTVVQLLHKSQCGFACTTPSEISLALSSGIPPEDIIFHAPFKLKSHLNYLREMNICLMSFDDDVGLHKIAHEFPTAQLLLQIIITEEAGSVRRSGMRVGATRDMWAPLLALATKLHLHVIGISLQTDSGVMEAGAFEGALATAQQIFTLAADNGQCMNTLDLGNIVKPQRAFESLTDSINEQLSQWFPAKTFPDLRVFAELGKFFTPGVCDHG